MPHEVLGEQISLTVSEYSVEATDVVKRYPFRRTSRRAGRNIFRAILGMDRANIVALNKATFRVKKGEVFGLLGPNGAGKTTMIKILSTLLSYEEGQVTVNGFDLNKDPNQVLKNLQTVLTGSLGFEWRLTVRQSLEFYARLYGMSKGETDRRIEELLDITGIRSYENMMFQGFSSGMARRVLLARALLRDVPILLFDEPTANLDPNSAVRFRRIIKDLSVNSGKTVLLATHNMFEAQDLCDDIAIIDKGHVVTQGTPSEVRHMFGRSMKIILKVRFGDSESGDALLGSLRATPDVQKVTMTGDDGDSKIVLEGGTGLDINSLLRNIIAANVVVRSLETSYPTLEDAFVALTAGDQS